MTKYFYYIVFHLILILIFNPIWIIAIPFSLVVYLTVDIGLHRLWTHKSYECNLILKNIMFYLSTISGLSLIGFVSMHRYHHKYSDTKKDPTWYNDWKRFLNIIFQTNFYMKYINTKEMIIMSRDVIKNSLYSFQHKHLYNILIILNIILLIIDPILAVTFLSIPVIFSYILLVPLSGIAQHTFWDAKWLNIITLGLQSSHNYHHKHPTKYDWSSNGEFDLGGKLVHLIKTN